MIHRLRISQLGMALWLCFSIGVGAQTSAPDPVVASVGSRPIRLSEVDTSIGGRLFAIRSQEYSLRKEALDELVTRIVVTSEADRRHISVEQLLKDEVDSRAIEPDEAEVSAALLAHPLDSKSAVATEERSAIRERLRVEKRSVRFREFVKGLKEEASVSTLLEPPRLAVTVGNAPTLGAPRPDVTVVLFSDFQCPFCRTMAPSFKEMIRRYAGHVRFVFKNYPLAGHPDAPQAAEAALCAGDQGSFWEMHDLLFANQRNLHQSNLIDYSRSAGLKVDQFIGCLASGSKAHIVQRDIDEARSYGVSATPTMFVNGRSITGALSIEAFARLLDDELKKSSQQR